MNAGLTLFGAGPYSPRPDFVRKWRNWQTH
jgi:hypothetical protein